MIILKDSKRFQLRNTIFRNNSNPSFFLIFNRETVSVFVQWKFGRKSCSSFGLMKLAPPQWAIVPYSVEICVAERWFNYNPLSQVNCHFNSTTRCMHDVGAPVRVLFQIFSTEYEFSWHCTSFSYVYCLERWTLFFHFYRALSLRNANPRSSFTSNSREIWILIYILCCK